MKSIEYIRINSVYERGVRVETILFYITATLRDIILKVLLPW